MTDYLTPKALRPSTLAERKAERVVADAASGRDPRLKDAVLAGVVTRATYSARNPNVVIGTRRVETWINRKNGRFVAEREVGGPFQFPDDGPSAVKREEWVTVSKSDLRAQKEPMLGAPAGPQILSVATLDRRSGRITETAPE